MLPSLSQPTLVSPKEKVMQPKVLETPDFMVLDFSEFDQHKAGWNRKDQKKISTTAI